MAVWGAELQQLHDTRVIEISKESLLQGAYVKGKCNGQIETRPGRASRAISEREGEGKLQRETEVIWWGDGGVDCDGRSVRAGHQQGAPLPLTITLQRTPKCFRHQLSSPEATARLDHVIL